MPHISDSRFDALRAQLPLAPPTTNDLLFEWTLTQGGSGNTLNDRIYTMLIFQGATPGHVNDMWAQVLALNGFGGSLNDQLKQFWESGGSFSGSPLDNLLLDASNLDEYLLEDGVPGDVYLLEGSPFVAAQAASGYIVSEISNANPGLSSGTRLDCFWRQDGLKVWTARQGDTIRQYDVSPAWSIVGSPSDWTFDFTTGAIGNLRSVWWSPDGTKFSHCQRVPATSVRVTVFDQSATPWDITVLGASTTKSWTPTGGITPQDMIWSPDGTRLWLQGPIGITAPIHEFTVAVAWDASTIVSAQVNTFDGVGTNTLAFSADGTKLYMMFGQVLNSYDLNPAFDVSTASNLIAGPTVPGINVTVPRGLTYRDDNGDIFVAGDQSQRKCAWFR